MNRDPETIPSCPWHPDSRVATERPCGCVELECGAVATCDDYHHGDGVLLEDCVLPVLPEVKR